MRDLCIMIKPASSLCNLRCRYCFYCDVADSRQVPSYGIMTHETVVEVLDHIYRDLDPGDHITFAFQGGEPCVAGLTWFQEFCKLVQDWKEIGISYVLQTNAILLDEDWCAFLKEHNFLVGVSWDIHRGTHEDARVDAGGVGTYDIVAEKIRLLEKRQIDFNVLCTLTNILAQYPDQVWKQLVKYNITYVQFTPCLDDLEAASYNRYALTPGRYLSFYNRIFELWYEEIAKGRMRSIKLFDDIMNLLAYGRPTACGIDGKCSPQIIVEADGSTYPCDFYCLDNYCLGNLRESNLRDIYTSDQMRGFINRSHELPPLCVSCLYNRFCGGGCKRMGKQIYCGERDTVCAYREFLRLHIPAFRRLIQAYGQSHKEK